MNTQEETNIVATSPVSVETQIGTIEIPAPVKKPRKPRVSKPRERKFNEKRAKRYNYNMNNPRLIAITPDKWYYVVSFPETDLTNDAFVAALKAIPEMHEWSRKPIEVQPDADSTAVPSVAFKQIWRVRATEETLKLVAAFAKKFKFDVFNALTLMDNALFLNEQKFGGGDGQLHYYLYNYNTNPIAGGIDEKNAIDQEGCSGMGLVML